MFDSLKDEAYNVVKTMEGLMIRCTLSTILGSKRMTRTELCNRSGISLTSLKPFYDDTWKGIRRETLDSICKALGIRVGDLLEYVATEEKSKKGRK